jgi:GR25 family glycosyltransferase involved in LPS biosynthesis/glycosyltransferase involved in cell wall biosynthesis
MIVKNESRIIVDTLTKLLKKIKWDYWVICDTGSTDNTRELITEFFEKENIPGELFCDEWRDFGYNRTEALKKAFGKTDYVFIFDADDEICLDFKLPEVLDHDAYNFQFGGHHDYNAYTRTLLVNNHKLWKYVGVLHEVIVPDGHTPLTYVISGNYFVVSGRLGDRNTNNPDKYLKDAQVLEKAYHEALEKGDNIHERYAFYCANSYKDYGKHEKAIEWYKKTLTHNNWCQEKYICCLRLYDCYDAIGQKETGYYYCVKSFSYDQERAEGLNKLITHYCCEGLNEIAFSYYQLMQDFIENRYLTQDISAHNHKLFIENNVLSFFLPYYMVIVTEKIKKHDVGLKMYEIIFTKKTKNIPEFYIRCLLFNLRFFIDHLKPESKDHFISLFNDYLQFLESNSYPVFGYDFLDCFYNYGVNSKYTLKVVEPFNNVDIEKCKESNKILFYSGFAGVKWNQTYSLSNALGGSETAVAYLSKFLPKNYEIYVGGEVEEEDVDNVHYVHQFNLPELLKNNVFHTIVVSRYVGFFEMFPYYSSYQTFLWAHDTCFNAYGAINMNDQTVLKKWLPRITGVVCLTPWHKEHMERIYPMINPESVKMINNGVKVEMFKYPLVKTKNLFIYTSCAERGLDRLLELWPSIIEKYPDAQLKISSYNDFPKNESEIKMSHIIYSHPSIQHFGKLGPEQLYELMSTAEYWLYPTNWPETSCITALEMLKSEIICVYYPIAGLTNTMDSYGIAINHGEEISTIESLTEDKKLEMRLLGREYAESCSWENRAKTWSQMFQLETKSNIVLDICDVQKEAAYIKVVNLERREDRKIEMIEKFKKCEITDYEIIKATDGKHLLPSVELKRLFEGNDFNYRRGVLGCALSHFKLWKELTLETTLDYYVILEDDIELSEQFKGKLDFAIAEFTRENMDYLYLGANSLHTVNVDSANLKCVRSDGEQGEGTYAYIISRHCAEKILDYFNKNGMKRAIDFTPVYKSILDGIFYLNESIVHTYSIQHHGEHVDSDIQKDYDFVDMSGVGDLDSDDESSGLYEDFYRENYTTSK